MKRPTDFQYKDHVTSATGFEWQSQNRTGQASADGQDIENHAARGVAVHLPCARPTRYQDLTFLVMLFGGGMT